MNRVDGVGAVVKVEINFIDSYLEENFGPPTIGTAGAAAVDLRACFKVPITLWPGHELICSAGFKMHMPRGLCALIIPRSGLGWKHVVLANGTGLIDSDYQGEIRMKVMHRGPKGSEPVHVKPYDRLAQMIFVHYYEVQWERVAQFSEATNRGEGGFGHTGVE